MSLTFNQATSSGYGGSATSIAFTITAHGPSVLVLCAGDLVGSGTLNGGSVTDSAGNTWWGFPNSERPVFVAYNTTSGSLTITLHASTAGSQIYFIVAEYTGSVVNTKPISFGVGNPSSSPFSYSWYNGKTNCQIVTVGRNNEDNGETWTDGSTGRTVGGTSGTGYGVCADRFVSGAGVVTTSGTISGSVSINLVSIAIPTSSSVIHGAGLLLGVG